MKDGKGVFGSDANTEALHARFAEAGISPTEDSRRLYRELLFTTPGIERFLSAACIPEEAFGQSTSDGTLFPDFLTALGIVVGIACADTEANTIAQVGTYRSRGARAARLRASVDLDEEDSLSAESADRLRILASSARELQTPGLVPICGVMLPPFDASRAEREESALLRSLAFFFETLKEKRVDLSGCIVEIPFLPPREGEGPREAAERTIRAATAAIPDETGGVLFRSFETTPEGATESLNAVARLEPLPWPVAFSFSRALTDPVLTVWRGNAERRAEAQAVFSERLAMNVAADQAGYVPGMERR